MLVPHEVLDRRLARAPLAVECYDQRRLPDRCGRNSPGHMLHEYGAIQFVFLGAPLRLIVAQYSGGRWLGDDVHYVLAGRLGGFGVWKRSATSSRRFRSAKVAGSVGKASISAYSVSDRTFR